MHATPRRFYFRDDNYVRCAIFIDVAKRIDSNEKPLLLPGYAFVACQCKFKVTYGHVWYGMVEVVEFLSVLQKNKPVLETLKLINLINF